MSMVLSVKLKAIDLATAPIKASGEKLKKTMSTVSKDAGDAIKKHLGYGLKVALTGNWDELHNVFRKMLHSFVDNLGKSFGKMVPLLINNFKRIITFAKFFFGFLNNRFQGDPRKWIAFARKVILVGMFFKKLKEDVTKFFNFTLNAFKQIAFGAFWLGKSILNGIGGGLKGTLSILKAFGFNYLQIAMIGNAVAQTLIANWSDIKTTLIAIGSFVLYSFKELFSSLKTIWVTSDNVVIIFLKHILESAKSFIIPIIEVFKFLFNGLKLIIEAGGGTVVGALNFIFSTIATTFSNSDFGQVIFAFVQKIKLAFHLVKATFIEIIKSIIGALADSPLQQVLFKFLDPMQLRGVNGFLTRLKGVDSSISEIKSQHTAKVSELLVDLDNNNKFLMRLYSNDRQLLENIAEQIGMPANIIAQTSTKDLANKLKEPIKLIIQTVRDNKKNLIQEIKRQNQETKEQVTQGNKDLVQVISTAPFNDSTQNKALATGLNTATSLYGAFIDRTIPKLRTGFSTTRDSVDNLGNEIGNLGEIIRNVGATIDQGTQTILASQQQATAQMQQNTINFANTSNQTLQTSTNIAKGLFTNLGSAFKTQFINVALNGIKQLGTSLDAFGQKGLNLATRGLNSLKKGIIDATDYSGEMYDGAESMGMEIQEYQALQHALAVSGIRSTQFAGVTSKTQQLLQDFVTTTEAYKGGREQSTSTTTSSTQGSPLKKEFMKREKFYAQYDKEEKGKTSPEARRMAYEKAKEKHDKEEASRMSAWHKERMKESKERASAAKREESEFEKYQKNKAVEFFTKLGFSEKEVTELLKKSQLEQLTEIQRRLKTLDTNQRRYLQRMLGGRAMDQLMRVDLGEEVEKQKAMGTSVTDEQILEAEKVAGELDALTIKWKQFMVKLFAQSGDGIASIINQVSSLLTILIGFIDSNKALVTFFVANLLRLAIILVPLMATISGVGKAFNTLSTAYKWITSIKTAFSTLSTVIGSGTTVMNALNISSAANAGSIGRVSSGFSNFGRTVLPATIKAITSFLATLSSSLLIFGQILLVLAAVAVAIYAIVEAYKEWKKWRDAVEARKNKKKGFKQTQEDILEDSGHDKQGFIGAQEEDGVTRFSKGYIVGVFEDNERSEAIKILRQQGITYTETVNRFPELKDKIPKFAKGGIVTKPMIGMVGEAGAEAIIPLKKLPRINSGNNIGNNGRLRVDHNYTVSLDKDTRSILGRDSSRIAEQVISEIFTQSVRSRVYA